jgi:hypothetical protein
VGEECFGGLVKGRGGFRFRRAKKGYGFSAVAAFTDNGLKRDFSEKGDFDTLAFALGPALAEEVVAFAVVAFEVRHVLDQAENGNVDLGKHRDGLAGVDHGDFLRGGDDDCAIERDCLDNGELNVTGARWEVEDEDIEFSPSDLLEELLGVSIGEGTADDDRGVVAEEEAHRHEFEAVGFDGNDAILTVGIGRLVRNSEHQGNGGTVKITVEKADFEALLQECDGEVAGDSGLSDAAFAGADGNDAFDARDGGRFAGSRTGGRGILNVDFNTNFFAPS